MRSRTAKKAAALAPLCLALISACDCDGLGNVSALGHIDPAILDLGPVPLGEECRPELTVVSNGRSQLDVTGSELVDTNGTFELLQVPQKIDPGGEGALLLSYTSGGTENERQSTTIELVSNAAENEGLLTAVVTALPTNETAGVAVPKCDGVDEEGEDVRLDPCPELSFGAVQINPPGLPLDQRSGRRNLQVEIVNEGNAAFDVQAAVIDGGDGDFAIEALLTGNVLGDLPITLTPGRASACAPLTESSCVNPDDCNVMRVDVVYTPTALGADVADLVIFTDAAEGSELRIPLSGSGSDIGIAFNPEVVNFSDVAEGGSGSIEVNVRNIGSNDAPVNDTCIDLDGDESCDGYCTGGDDELVLDGTLGCDVLKADGSNEGKGFVLGPTDAEAGGNDERTLVVTWNPVAGAAQIPAGTVIRLETSILNNTAYELPVGGGGAGVLVPTIPSANICGDLICLPSTGDVNDTQTWVASIDFTLENTGDASLDVTSFEWESDDEDLDFTLLDTSDAAINLASPGITLAPNASVTLRVDYANNDFSQQDVPNLLVNHTGLGGQLVLPFNVLPPQ
jgi:hypothetical protein